MHVMYMLYLLCGRRLILLSGFPSFPAASVPAPSFLGIGGVVPNCVFSPFLVPLFRHLINSKHTRPTSPISTHRQFLEFRLIELEHAARKK